jgi:serine/threonine-protein phosphatase 2B catalytic subunit
MLTETRVFFQVQAPALTIPSDAEFFQPDSNRSKPNTLLLKEHFTRQGRISEQHAFFIIEKATELLRAEENILSIEAPVTGTV